MNSQDLQKNVLLAAAHLSHKEGRDLDSQQVETFVKAIDTKVLSPGASSDPRESALLVEAGVACFSILSSAYSLKLDERTLLKVVSVTGSQEPWSTAKSASSASDILNEQLPGEILVDFIVGPILQRTLKPLFNKPSSKITASGRPSQYTPVDDRSRQFAEPPTWKSHAPWAVATLQWAVDMSEQPSLIQEHWPLFTPVLLTLVEDESIDVKSKGLEILASFVSKCPVQVLHNTGIGRVFEDATFPFLLYLPSVTPEDESTSILVPAYNVLISLAEAYEDHHSLERRRLLDKVLREGVFAGHFHASQYNRIVQVLMQKTASIVKCLGIYSIKHLKNLLSMTSSIMTDPFATAHPPTVLAAAQTLNAIMANCWPRIQETEHTEPIIRIAALCWLNVHEDEEVASSQLTQEDVDVLSQELMRTSNILESVWAKDGSKRPAKLDEVLKQEPRLARLFPPALP
ncbi:hypothetical protein ACJZ2D_000004 [Fusarium nematophilum]